MTVLGASPNAAAYLELHKRFQGYVLPMKGKEPDAQMSKRQRGTAAWKNGRDSYYQRPPTLEEVSEWAAEGCGISGVTGPRSGVVALEIDCPELLLPLLDLPGLKTQILSTPIATSPSGGFHFLFRHRPNVKGQSVRCPLFNDKDSPCFTGKGELASMRAGDQLIVLPPGPGREWLPGQSITEVEPADVPPGLVDLLERFTEGGEKRLPIEQDTDNTPPIEHNPCPIGNTVLLEDKGRYVLLEVDPSVLSLAMDKGSPLIPALVNRLGGRGVRVPCPYHPPDQKASANFWYSKGWYLADHHFDPPHNVPVSQLCADLATGYLERCRNGSGARHQHRVYKLNKDSKIKVDPQAFVWLTLAAADLGLVTLPPSRLLQKLTGFAPGGERALRFIDKWERAWRCTGNKDVFPLARTFLISVLYALPAPVRPATGEKEEPKTPEWLAAYNEIDNALYRARRQGILEKVEPGNGGKSALYRVCTNGGKQ